MNEILNILLSKDEVTYLKVIIAEHIRNCKINQQEANQEKMFEKEIEIRKAKELMSIISTCERYNIDKTNKNTPNFDEIDELVNLSRKVKKLQDGA